MRNLPLTLLRALAAVYETGGIRSAGRLLGIQHSAVSRAIRDLEKWIEAPLFEARGTQRALVFTAEGAALGQAALLAMRKMETAVSKAREGSNPNSVTVATTPSFAIRWLLPRLRRLEKAHPKIEVSILVDQARNSPNAVGADLNIRMGVRPTDTDDPIPWLDESVFPVLAPRCWEENGQPRLVDCLIGLPLLHDRDPSTSWGAWRAAFGPKQLNVRQGVRLTSSDLVLRAAEQGQGVALARERLAADSLSSGVLLRPFEQLEIKLGINYWIILNPETKHRRVVREVVDWLRTLEKPPCSNVK